MLTRRARDRKNMSKRLFFGAAWRFQLTCARMYMFMMGIVCSQKRNRRGYGYYKAVKVSRRGC